MDLSNKLVLPRFVFFESMRLVNLLLSQPDLVLQAGKKKVKTAMISPKSKDVFFIFINFYTPITLITRRYFKVLRDFSLKKSKIAFYTEGSLFC